MKIASSEPICVHNMFSTCSELAIFMNNLLSYCGLVGAKIKVSDKDLPVHNVIFRVHNSKFEYVT